MQCKPKSPDCSKCSLANDCVAFNTGKTQMLPVKLKKLSLKKKYFNFIVVKSKNNKTIIEQRVNGGIWQSLYQFPLIETTNTINKMELKILSKHQNIKNLSIDAIELFNEKEIIHRLSHQELHIKFWIIYTTDVLNQGIFWSQISKLAVPIVIDRFIREFQA